MHVRLLGPPELWANGLVAPLGGSRQRALLALLALRAGEVVPRDRLIEALSELGHLKRREFHEALLEAATFEDLPGKWQAANPGGGTEPAEAARCYKRLALAAE